MQALVGASAAGRRPARASRACAAPGSVADDDGAGAAVALRCSLPWCRCSASSRSQSSTVRRRRRRRRPRRRRRGGRSGSGGSTCGVTAGCAGPEGKPSGARRYTGPAHAAYDFGSMTPDAAFRKIELHLIRVLQTLISERSVSRAAMRLRQQPAPGERPAAAAARPHRRRAAGARRQRHDADRDGDAIAGPGDARCCARPTACSARAPSSAASTPAPAEATFRIAASDYLDPLFLPELVAPRQAARAAGAARAAAADRATTTIASASPPARSTW